MNDTVTVGCSLPHGLVLELGLVNGRPPIDEKTGRVADTYQHVELNGRSKAAKGAKFGTTPVPVAFWSAWLKANSTLRYVQDRSVFVVGSDPYNNTGRNAFKVSK